MLALNRAGEMKGGVSGLTCSKSVWFQQDLLYCIDRKDQTTTFMLAFCDGFACLATQPMTLSNSLRH